MVNLAPRAKAKPNMEENIITCPCAYVSNILFEQIVLVVLYLNRNINFTSYMVYSSGSMTSVLFGIGVVQVYCRLNTGLSETRSEKLGWHEMYRICWRSKPALLKSLQSNGESDSAKHQ